MKAKFSLVPVIGLISILLASLIGCAGGSADYQTGYDAGYESGYDFGYDDGYIDAARECLEIIASMNVTEPEEENLSASFVISKWTQNYYESWEEWSDSVEVWYEVENTGNVEIDYYKVYFVATCVDGSRYYDWTNGSDVRPGDIRTSNTFISVANKEVVSVEIDDWELKHY